MKVLLVQFRKLLAAVLLLIAAYSNAQTVIPAKIPVSYDVSPSGAFTYSVPIEVPPGIKEMVPGLAISYNSQGGNGNLGMGWAISGLSAITRGVTTIFHHQQIDPVDFDANDVYMLDGQKLFSNGSNIYKTEQKNFALIRAVGTAGNGPAYFIVEYPGGLTYEYGNSVSSKFVAQSKSDVYTWAVNKISDRNGNFIEFDYNSNSATGSYYVTSIVYGLNSNTGGGAYHSVDFTYVNRPDITKFWVSGSLITDDKILDKIEVKQDGTQVINTYDFTYEHEMSGNDLDYISHLVQIDEIRPGNVKLPPIKINWGKKDLQYATVPYDYTAPTLPQVISSMGSVVTGDINGDGATDYANVTTVAPQAPIYVNLSDKDNGFSNSGTTSVNYNISGNVASSMAMSDTKGKLYFDYNVDGFEDMFLIIADLSNTASPKLVIEYYQSDGTTLNYHSTIFSHQENNPDWIHFCNVYPGDYDGNGKTELLITLPTGYTGYLGYPTPIIATGYDLVIVGEDYPTLNGAAQTSNMVGHVSNHNNSAFPMDFNGDGKNELCRVALHSNGDIDIEAVEILATYSPSVALYNPGNSLSTKWIAGTPSKNDVFMPGDFNSDGKTDFLVWNSSPNTWNILYSTGTGITGASLPQSFTSNVHPNGMSYNSSIGTVNCTYRISDFNGDGHTDILEMGNDQSSPYYKMFYGWGHGEFTYETATLPQGIYAPHNQLGDFNGDGQMDMLVREYSNGVWSTHALYFHPENISHQVSSIEHAGQRLDIEIKKLSSANPDVGDGYDKDHYGYNQWTVNGHGPSDYPYITKQIPLKVVTKLEDNISLNRSYYYQTLQLHLTGLGMLGFEKVRVRDFSTGILTESHYSLFPFWGSSGQYSVTNFLYQTTVSALNGTQSVMKNTQYNYRDVPGDVSDPRVRIIKQYNVIDIDYVNGLCSDNYTEYDPNNSLFYDYGVPEFNQVESGVRNGSNWEVTNYTYDNTLSFINKPKPVEITKTTTYSGKSDYSRTTRYKYDALGQLEELVTDPGTINTNTTAYTYDPYGNLASSSVTGSAPGGVVLNRIKDHTYTTDRRFLKTTTSYNGSDQYVDEFVYDNWGNVTSKKENVLETLFFYDAIGRLVKTIFPEDIVTEKAYNWGYLGNDAFNSNFTNYQVITSNFNDAQFYVKTWTTGLQAEHFEYLDFYGKTLRKAYSGFNGNKIYEDTRYEYNGQPYYSTRPYEVGTSHWPTFYYYNEFGQEYLRGCAAGPSYTTIYTASINPCKLDVEVTNTSTGQTKVTSSDAGGVFRVEDNGNTIEYDYNSNGKPDFVQVNNDPSLVTSYTYDDFGRVFEKTEPNVGTKTYTYNSFDEVINEHTPNGINRAYTYNAIGQVSSRQEGVNLYTYHYYGPTSPASGKIKQAKVSGTLNNSTTDYLYDAFGRPYQMIEKPDATKTFTTEYAYNNLGRVSQHKYPSGVTVTKNYNTYGYLESIDLPNQRLFQINSKNHFGQITQAQYYKAFNQPSYVLDRSYNPDLGYPIMRKVTGFNSSVFVHEEYTFDQYSGNLNRRENLMNGLHEDFTYDNLDRLTNVTSNAAVPPLQMTYNAHGNILLKSDIGSAQYPWIYEKYALRTVPDLNGQPGVPLTDVRQQQDQDVTYHSFNRVYTIDEGPDNVTFLYSPDEQRNKADFNQGQRVRYYGNNYEETIENGITKKVTYIYAENEPIAIIYDVQGVSSVYYLATDYLGSITHVLNTTFGPNTTIIEERSFDAWGRPRDPSNWQYFNPGQAPGWIIDRGYTGHEHIFSNSGFDFNVINMNGRLYDPLVGRMFSPDPYVVDPSSTETYNKYSYAANNPMKYTDPDGEWIHIAIGAVVGGVINWATHGATFDMKGLGYFGIGALAGGLTAATGGAVAGAIGFSGMLGGAVVGAATGFTGGVITGAGNAYLEGANFGEGMNMGLQEGVKGAIAGAILGGVSGGVSAAIKGRNVLNGRYTKTALRRMGVSFTGNPVAEDDVQSFYKEKFPDADNFRHGRPGLSINDAKVGKNHALTIPDSWTRASGSNIFIKHSSLASDKMLFYTLDHELAHARWFDNGTFAMLNQLYGKHNAIILSEKYAYDGGIQLSKSWGDTNLLNWSIKMQNFYLNSMFFK